MKKLFLIRQTNQSECGLCCISMIASFHEFYQPIKYYRNTFRIGRDGISLKDMVEILEKINLKTRVQKVNDIVNFNFEDIIYIAYMNQNHFVVIEKLKNKLKIYDPAKGIYLQNLDAFQESFSGFLIDVKKNSDFLKVNKRESPFKHIIEKSLLLKKNIIVMFFISIISYIVSVIVPIVLQEAIDEYTKIANKNYDSIISLIVIVFIYYLLSLIRNNIIVTLQKKLYDVFTYDTSKHLLKIGYEFFDNRSQGDILFRMNLLSQVQSAVSTNLIQLLVSFTSILVLLIVVILNYAQIFPILVSILVLFGCWFIYTNKILSKSKQSEMKSREKLNNITTEIINNMFQIRCINLVEYFNKSFNTFYKEFIVDYEKNQKLNLKYNLIFSIFFNYAPIFILVFLITFPLMQAYSYGELFAIYSLLGMFFSQGLIFVSEILNYSMLRASLFYLNDLWEEDEIEDNSKIEMTDFNLIEIKNLGFSYNALSNPVLSNINIKIKKGEKIAIVGKSGTGKSTLIKLLARLYDSLDGNIYIDNTPIQEIKKESYNNIISFVPQSPVFFNKSIRENIIMGKENISDNDIILALNVANLYHEIEKMPLKLDTIVSGQGGNISGGQIQRLSIARAIVSIPKIIIMDEATSSLDSYNEKIIYDNLKNLNISQLVISHRLSTIIDSDYIYCIDKGSIIEEGTHDELINIGGFYYTLFYNSKSI